MTGTPATQGISADECHVCGSHAALVDGRLDAAGFCPDHWPRCLSCGTRVPIEEFGNDPEFRCAGCRP